MIILGVNCLYHESSACLIRDGVLIAAAEEERFNRRKHGKEVRADNPDELPEQAIKFCLAAAGAKASDVEFIAIAGDPVTMRRVHQTRAPSPWADRDEHATFLAKLDEVALAFTSLGFRAELHWIGHHEAHAASALHFSGMEDAAVLVVDALGDDAFSTLSASASAGRINPILRVAFPASIGYLWELVSVFLGFSVYDAAKVMGLAAYGNPAQYASAYDRLAWPTGDGGFSMNAPLLHFERIMYNPSSAWLDGLTDIFAIAPRRPDDDLEAAHYDLAAGLQALTNNLMLHMVTCLGEMTQSRNLCLAGGVALNCVSNSYAFENSDFAELFVQPAAHDAGLALGAASTIWRNHLDGRPLQAMRHAYYGPKFDDAVLRAALTRANLSFEKPADIELEVAKHLSKGKVVANFDGAMELGPRALGNRSILADPRNPEVREVINRIIKHREIFRPLAPSILSSRAGHWFDIGKPTPASDFMLMTYPGKENAIAATPAVLHHDKSARIQTVDPTYAPRFANILIHFEEITGIPMVLNTSYNDQAPIVCTPEDAIAAFIDTPLDILAIGPYIISKE